MKNNVIEAIKKYKIISIVRGVEKKDIVQTAQALYDGGIRLVEITFDQSDCDCIKKTTDMITLLVDTFKEKLMIGAGTVMTVLQCEAAFNAGASYIISPDTNIDVIHKSNELGVVSIPGALTPTEVASAYHWGGDFIKLFPAGDIGTGYIKSIKCPLKHIPMLAVGAINIENICDFFNAGIDGVGIGGNIVDLNAINNNNFEKITMVSKQYVEKVNV